MSLANSYGTVRLREIMPFWGRMLLESRAGINDLEVVESSENAPQWINLTVLLEGYIIKEVFHDAEVDEEWQAASQDEISGIEFREIHVWFFKGRRPLEAGIELFTHHVQGAGDSIEASPLLRRVLLRAADKAVRGPIPTRRRADIAMFHYRISKDALGWNAVKKVFEGCPATGFDQNK